MITATRKERRAYGLGEFAQMFGISKDTAKRRVMDGSLRTIMVGGRRLVPIGEVERIERDGLVKQAR
jgi:excisionase family DNA binding protein